MNVFVLDSDMAKCAEYHCDKHIVKMPLELAQLVSTANKMCGSYLVPEGYKITHKNHPWAIYTRYNQRNYDFVCELGIYLCKEYSFRYGKRHACQDILEALANVQIVVSECNDKHTLPKPLCMPDEYKANTVIDSYRNYYRFKKDNISFTYKNRKEPDWL